MVDLQDKYKEVRTQLQSLGLPWDMPPHLVLRIVAVLADEEIRHCDSDLTAASPRTYSGRVLAFTDTRVVLAVIADGPSQPQPNEKATFSVTVETWSRTKLEVVQLLPNSEGWRNSDRGWSHMTTSGYPDDLAVTLRYPGREDLTLPLAGNRQGEQQTQKLYAFLPELFLDLAIH